jgi:inner membrane protein
MDSLSQLVLGAAVAAAIVPAKHRRKALIVGAMLGTLPDLDVLIRYSDDVRNMTYHRGFSHSLMVLPFVSIALWWLARQFSASVREHSTRWFFAILLGLMTHPLLDAMTIYGTQLFWPLITPPVMGGSMFIIDPLYTLPLLIAVMIAAFTKIDLRASRAVNVGLLLSTGYLAWSLIAQQWVSRIVDQQLAGTSNADAPRFVTAAPFNTLLWRIVVLTPEGYLEGDYSLVADRGKIDFQQHSFDRELLSENNSNWAVQRLLWFSHGFQRADIVNDELVLSDLRMGAHPYFIFAHAVAKRQNGDWKEGDNRQVSEIGAREGQLAGVWSRIWSSNESSVGD